PCPCSEPGQGGESSTEALDDHCRLSPLSPELLDDTSQVSHMESPLPGLYQANAPDLSARGIVAACPKGKRHSESRNSASEDAIRAQYAAVSRQAPARCTMLRCIPLAVVLRTSMTSRLVTFCGQMRTIKSVAATSSRGRSTTTPNRSSAKSRSWMRS